MAKRTSLRTAKVVRAWTDPKYRASLTAEERASLPASPAGSSDGEEGLTKVTGAWTFGSGCGSMGCGTWCWTVDIGPTCGGTCDAYCNTMTCITSDTAGCTETMSTSGC